MEEKKKNNKGLIVIIVILTVLLLGVVGYICYDKGVFDELSQKEEQKDSENMQKAEEKISVLEVEKLIKTVPYSSEDGITYKDPYSGSLITIDNINNRLLLEYASRQISDKNQKFDGNPKTLENILKDNYNIDTVKHQDFLNWKYDGGKYVLYPGGGQSESNLLSKLVDYKIEDGQLVVLEKVGFVMHGDNLTISTDRSSSSNKVIKVVPYDNEEDDNDPREYFDNNLDKFNTFKHTFKKADNGKYYWYSSEAINE